MSMKTIARGLVVACCAALGLTALAEAPTPVVVFNGDLINGAHKNGKFEVSKRTEDSQVSIADGFASLTKTQGTGAPQGVKIAWAQDTLPGTQLTVLVKYSGFDKNSGRTALLSAEWGTYDVSVSHSWDKKFNAGFYTHGSVGNNAGTERTASAAYDIPASGIMMVAMNSQPTPDTTAGTRVAFYDATTSALVEKWRDSGLRWKDSTFKNILVGGTVGPQNHYYRPTMTVEAVAIFDKALTIDEANEYVFPTLHRFTGVSGTKTLTELLGETTIANGDDVALVMTGNTTLTLPSDVAIGQIGAYGTGELTIANLATPVTGTASIGALGIAGETLTKEGTGTLYVKNGDTSAVEGYSKVAIDGKTVNIVEGKIELNNGNDDANFNNPTFNIGTYGELDCYGWIRSKGTMTIENATDKTILTNRGGNSGNLADVPNIVKKGEGKLIMTCNLNSGNATSSTIDIQAGTLCLKNGSNKTLNGVISGAGSLEIDVGTDHSVKLGSNANTMSSIIVTSGALDVAGKKPTTPYTVVANGGTIKSSGSHIYANENSIKSLTLNADTSLTGGHRFGLTTSNGAETTLDLGEHTLNVAIGTTEHCINFRKTTVSGEGTIAVGENSFMLVYDNGSGSMVAEDATVTMTATSKLELNTAGTLTVKAFEAADGASIVGGNDRQGTLKVLGTYKNTNAIQKLDLADGATIDVAAIPANGVVASATQSLTLGEGVKLAINGEETTDYTLVLSDDGKSVIAKSKGPKATVTEITEGLPADIDAAYVFTIGETAEGYEDYDANFEVSFNRAIAQDSVVLKGSYGAYLWQQIDMPKDLEANEVWTLLPAGTVNYGEVMGNVVEFTCGVKNYAAANAGATMTVELVLTKEGAEKVVMSTTTYTLTHAEATIAGQTVTDVTPVETIVPAAQAEKIIAAGVKAPAIIAWAKATGSTILVGKEIDLEAFALNCAATETAKTDAVDAILEELASKVDISKMTAGTLDAATLELLEKEYPMATIKLVESTKIQSTDTAKFFQLSIELK